MGNLIEELEEELAKMRPNEPDVFGSMASAEIDKPTLERTLAALEAAESIDRLHYHASGVRCTGCNASSVHYVVWEEFDHEDHCVCVEFDAALHGKEPDVEVESSADVPSKVEYAARGRLQSDNTNEGGPHEYKEKPMQEHWTPHCADCGKLPDHPCHGDKEDER